MIEEPSAGPAASDRSITGRGTEAERWLEWPGWAEVTRAGAAELVPVGRRLVVVAPHPDDEVLGSGGLVFEAARLGREVVVIGVTDGDASHPGSTLWPSDRLVQERTRERLDALEILGVKPTSLVRAGLSDGQVARAVDALTDALRGHLRSGDVVVAPWRWDGHLDHEATTEAALWACRQTGAHLLETPIWGWHWSEPEHGFLPRQPCWLLELPLAAKQAKEQALAAFVSQLTPDPSTGAEPILPQWVLARFISGFEVYLGQAR